MAACSRFSSARAARISSTPYRLWLNTLTTVGLFAAASPCRNKSSRADRSSSFPPSRTELSFFVLEISLSGSASSSTKSASFPGATVPSSCSRPHSRAKSPHPAALTLATKRDDQAHHGRLGGRRPGGRQSGRAMGPGGLVVGSWLRRCLATSTPASPHPCGLAARLRSRSLLFLRLVCRRPDGIVRRHDGLGGPSFACTTGAMLLATASTTSSGIEDETNVALCVMRLSPTPEPARPESAAQAARALAFPSAMGSASHP
jgi:hypothetical protein